MLLEKASKSSNQISRNVKLAVKLSHDLVKHHIQTTEEHTSRKYKQQQNASKLVLLKECMKPENRHISRKNLSLTLKRNTSKQSTSTLAKLDYNSENSK